jgi:hypothetical protein
VTVPRIEAVVSAEQSSAGQIRAITVKTEIAMNLLVVIVMLASPARRSAS